MAPLNYRSAEDCRFFTIAGKDFFRQWFQCTATQPSTDTLNPSVLLLTRQQGTVIICIEVKFGHRVLFNSVGNPWFHSWAGKLPGQGKDIGRGLLARSSRPPRRISQMFPLTSQVDPVFAVRAIPVKKISSRFPRVEEEEALRQTGMRSRGRCFMPLPPSGEVKKEEEMAQLSSQPVESPESKY